MPPKAKRNNANQHDKRHESGLAAPGKRITKQKSNPSLNGQANGKAGSGVPPPPLPSTGLNQGLVFPRPANHTNSTETIASASAAAAAAKGEERTGCLAGGVAGAGLGLGGAAGAGGGSGGLGIGGGAGVAGYEEKGRASPSVSVEDDASTMTSSQADEPATTKVIRRVSEGPAYKTSIVSSASSSLALAATILTSCPLRDAIAILILLLSLPPTLIITIHTLFASLTFVPPATANLSWNTFTSFPPIGDWFHATAAGGPSIFTMLTADAVMTLTYLCSPLFAQSVYLDLCQAVIAISLSGATAGKGGPANSVAICSVIVFLTHFLRYNKIHLAGFDYLRSVLHNLGTPITWTPTPVSAHSVSSPPIYGWPRTLLGCHILAQGLLTLLRRTLQSYSSHQRANAIKKQDPEAASLAEGNRASISAGSGEQDPVGSLSTDGRPPGPSPALRDGEKRLSNNKRKRKQANQVRSQQPLWAAIGSTKVTFLKEMEQKQASRDAIEAETANSNHADGLREESDTDRFWITEIGATEILFRADLSAWSSRDASTKTETGTLISAGIDKTKPFFVRINGADWGSTRISGVAKGDADVKTATKIWTGEIYGLTPLTKYSCEFVGLSDSQVICSTNVVTLPAPSAEQASVVPPPPQHQALRPLSPVSTLKQSIAAAEMKRDEARNKLKRTRKDHKNAASAIRKEIEQLHSKVASAGGQDERQRQRIMQLTQHLRQANDATAALKDETDALGEIPEDELTEYDEKKRGWQAVRDKRAAALAEMEAAKAEAQKELGQLSSELASLAQKKERLLARGGKLNEQLERLTVQKNADTSARQKHDHDRAARLQDYHRRENEMLYWIAKSNQEAEEQNINANHAFQQMEYVNTIVAQAQSTMSGPPTPEGDLPGTNGLQGRANTFDFPMFRTFPATSIPNHGINNQHQFRGGRGRSSSMLSGYSGFTDDLDVMPGMEENKSEGSSGSSGASQGDLMSPRPLVSKAMSPIGPPSSGVGASPKRR
ncbi:hypothetical protein AAFC00_006611 [Neodothiora populina]|uniref:Ubiquitination network signaling protein n=1 Tax=Neodothiora populina TaxID=2781224 RepID=A0ABR3PBU2_9PEZI